MAENYKLSNEIKEYIIEQKKSNNNLSCRGLASLIKERFQIDLSKSLINAVIKQENLSSPVGRRKVDEVVIPVSETVVSATEPAVSVTEIVAPVAKPELPVKETEIPAKEVKIPEKEPEITIIEAKSPEKEAIITDERASKVALTIPEVNFVWQGTDFMENGGFFFLKAADLKLDLTFSLAEQLSAYFPGLSIESHQAIIETLIYSPYFKHKKDLWLLIGAEVPEQAINNYREQLILVPFLQLKEGVQKVGIVYNSTEINWLWNEILLRLNSYVLHFFPPEYQFLDFKAMMKRFYFLPGKMGKRTGMLTIQLICPKSFFGFNDIIWQEGFSQAAARVNETKILTTQKDQIWINPLIQIS